MSTRSLHIIRHGKSSWDFENLSDIDRPLSPRGVDNAYLMARKLADRKVVPDLMLTSPANRALYTATIFARIMKVPFERIRITEGIYDGSADDLIGLIRRQDPSVSNLLLFGHNPAFTSLANSLMNHYIENIPTTGIVSLEYDLGDWNGVGKVPPKKDFFDYPRRYST
jgi:phosphohistidine phosphatase